MSLNFDTLFGPYADKIFINYDWTDVDSATGYVVYEGCEEVVGAGIEVIDAHGIALATDLNTSVKVGMKFVPNYDIRLKNMSIVPKLGGTDPTKAYILNSDFSILRQAPIQSGITASFEDLFLTSGTTYYAAVDHTGDSISVAYDIEKNNSNQAYPIADTNLNWTAGFTGTTDDLKAYAIDELETVRETYYHILEKTSERYNLSTNSVSFVNGKYCYNAETKILDVDFDTSILQKERVLRGKAYFRVPITWGTGSTSNQNVAAYIIVKIRKWNPTTSTETEITSAQSTSTELVMDSTDHNAVVYSTIANITDTTIAVGEQIRITIEAYAKNTTAAYARVDARIGHNIWGDATGTDRFLCILPFKIDTTN